MKQLASEGVLKIEYMVQESDETIDESFSKSVNTLYRDKDDKEGEKENKRKI